MIRKAAANIEAAQHLATRRLFDGAANRSYYAVYQAGWHFWEVTGMSAPTKSGRRYWRHNRILDALVEHGMHPFAEWEQEFDALQNLRVKADYYPDPVPEELLMALMSNAQRIVRWVQNRAEQ